MHRTILVFLATVLLIGAAMGALGRDSGADEAALTEEFLNDMDHVLLGRELFQRRCRLCHGRAAYPGKAPPLRPDRLSPEDIYLRITYGFGRMPAWEDQFSDHERMAITAYMKSHLFGN